MTQAMHQVLIVEDDPGIRDVLNTALGAHGYRVVEAENAERGLLASRSHKPDLVIVDLGLPDRDGLEVIERLRGWSTVPIVVLSARTMEAQKVAALDLGADDYVTKPFAMNELLARLRAAIRRRTLPADRPGPVRVGAASVDLARREATRDGRPLHLTPLEFRLLECLVRQAGLIVTPRQIIREVWGPDRVDDPRSLRVLVKTLRKKIEPAPHRPRYLVTEAGLGYRLRLEEPATTASPPIEER
jgi:two-component system, OmpR family, KDP operon response regulator KdpE